MLPANKSRKKERIRERERERERESIKPWSRYFYLTK